MGFDEKDRIFIFILVCGVVFELDLMVRQCIAWICILMWLIFMVC